MRYLPMAFCLLLALSRPALIIAQMAATSSPAPTLITGPPSYAPTTAAPIASTTSPSVEPINPDSPTLTPFVTEDPTAAPITGTPTAAPVADTPTAAPVMASVAPTTTSAPATSAPTSAPTTSVPTTPAPTTPGPITPAPTTPAPTKSPTSAPTKSPVAKTQSPTVGPTKFPTTTPTSTPTFEPSASPTTPKPSATPSVSPSVTITLSPTSSPSFTPSESPSAAPTKAPIPPGGTPAPTTKVDKTTSGLTMTLSGISKIEDTASWAKTTTKFFTEQYEESGQMTGTKVEVTLTSQKSSSGRRNMRGLQTDSVEVTYEQALAYSTSDSSLTLDKALEYPLSTTIQQDEYISALKQLDGYSGLTSVSTITVPSNINPIPNPETGGGGIQQWTIIAIVIVSVLALVALSLIVIRKRRDNRNAGSYVQEEPTYEQSGLGSLSGPGLGDETVETMDYDYAKAYGGLSGDASLSEAGGTMGSRAAHQAGNNTIFSEDPTFNEAYEGREEVIDVYAPAGKLGVVIDTPNDDAPVVHAVKDSSPIADQVRVGDKLVAVDDEDVRTMTAIKVSKLISKKSSNETRKLTIIRHVADN